MMSPCGNAPAARSERAVLKTGNGTALTVRRVRGNLRRKTPVRSHWRVTFGPGNGMSGRGVGVRGWVLYNSSCGVQTFGRGRRPIADDGPMQTLYSAVRGISSAVRLNSST